MSTGISNKSLGNAFERELCELLAGAGFWAHNLAQNQSGQPADIIAVRDGQAYLIDCKVCSKGKFNLRRVEENQDSAMNLWRHCGNNSGLFAIKLDGQIYMMSHQHIQGWRKVRSTLNTGEIIFRSLPFAAWVEQA